MTPPSAKAPQPPLAGLKVVDFSELLPGPFLTQCLADMGADVLKIERPPHGDPARRMAPGLFDRMNRGKTFQTLDLKNAEQHAMACDHIRASDVLVETYRPGVMQRLGLGYEAMAAMCPGLIYVSLTGYGQTGPDAALSGHDLNYLASTGVTALSGQADGAPAHGSGLPFADLCGSLYALSALLGALMQRKGSGRGQHLDVAISDCLLHLMNCRTGEFQNRSLESLAAQRREVLNKPAYGVFQASDGRYFTVAALEDHFWMKLTALLGMDDVPATWHTLHGRSEAAERVNGLLSAAFRKAPLTHWLKALRAHDIPHAQVIEPHGLATHPHHLARGMLDERVSGFPAARFPVRMA